MRNTKISRQVGELIALYFGGLNDADIARRLGCTGASIGNYRRRLGLPNHYRKESRRMVKHHDRIVEMANDGVKGTDIARAFGCTPEQVSYILCKQGVIRRRSLTDEEKLEMACLYESGVPMAEIVDSFPWLEDAQHVGAMVHQLRLQGWITARRRQHQQHKKWLPVRRSANRILDPEHLPQEAIQ